MFIGREKEFKFLQGKYDDRKAQLIVLYTLAKLTPLKSEAEFYYALFAESGFDDQIIHEAENSDNLYLYDLETIVNFKGL